MGCSYCFAMSRGGRRTSSLLIADHNIISRKILSSKNDNNYGDINSELLNHHMPIHFGGISDPFSNKDTSIISNYLLKSLSESQLPVIISTKNTHQLQNASTYDLLKNINNLVIQISFSTENNDVANIIEGGAPTPEDRLYVAKQLNKQGFYLIARIQPLFPSQIDNIINLLIPKLAEAGFKHIIVEFIKLPVEHTTSIIYKKLKHLGWNDQLLFKEHGSQLIGREWLLPTKIRWDLLQRVISTIHNYGMTYGAADYGLSHLGDSDCCCGISSLKGFENWFTGNFSNIIRQAPQGYIAINNIANYWTPKRSIQRYLNSNCRIDSKDHSILSYLVAKWNRPGTTNAPNSFLGVSYSGDRDKWNNCVYYKKQILN